MIEISLIFKHVTINNLTYVLTYFLTCVRFLTVIGALPVDKVRGQAGSAPCSDLSPLQWYEPPLIEYIKCYFMPK